MKYHFEYFVPKESGALPLEKSVTITKRGIQVGKALRQALELKQYKYVRIGIDEAVSAACIEPTTDKIGAFSITREFGGKFVSQKLIELVGSKPYVSVDSGVAILTVFKPTVEQERVVSEDMPPHEEKPVTEPQKKRGRPPKAQRVVSGERKEMCSNCDYHRPLKDTDARIKCEHSGQTKNFDAYCFFYTPEIK